MTTRMSANEKKLRKLLGMITEPFDAVLARVAELNKPESERLAAAKEQAKVNADEAAMLYERIEQMKQELRAATDRAEAAEVAAEVAANNPERLLRQLFLLTIEGDIQLGGFDKPLIIAVEALLDAAMHRSANGEEVPELTFPLIPGGAVIRYTYVDNELVFETVGHESQTRIHIQTATRKA